MTDALRQQLQNAVYRVDRFPTQRRSIALQVVTERADILKQLPQTSIYQDADVQMHVVACYKSNDIVHLRARL